MPCNSDYLAPSNRESELQRAATLLVYVQRQTGQEPEEWVVAEAKNLYASDARSVTELCAALKAMDPEQRDEIVYNARSKIARDLADWWEEHQTADSEREKREVQAKKHEKAKAHALAKLTKEERRALGY
jgi:hypothetical protein